MIEEVREKIQHKMDTAKLLSGAVAFGLAANFGILLDGDKLDALGQRAWTIKVSSVVLLVAAVLYFATMYAYDTLLMPKRFWGERHPTGNWIRRRRGRWLVARPPSSAAWILYQNMMRVWRNLFSVASLLVALGITVMGYGALRLNFVTVAVGGVLLILITGIWIWWSRPVLGSED